MPNLRADTSLSCRELMSSSCHSGQHYGCGDTRIWPPFLQHKGWTGQPNNYAQHCSLHLNSRYFPGRFPESCRSLCAIWIPFDTSAFVFLTKLWNCGFPIKSSLCFSNCLNGLQQHQNSSNYTEAVLVSWMQAAAGVSHSSLHKVSSLGLSSTRTPQYCNSCDQTTTQRASLTHKRWRQQRKKTPSELAKCKVWQGFSTGLWRRNPFWYPSLNYLT